MNIKKFLGYISVMLIILGILIVVYPIFSKHYYKKIQAIEIGKYDEIVNKKAKYYKEELEKAKLYNESLVKIQDLSSEEENMEILKEYNNILNIGDLGIMGYIEIPKINIKLPIYHDTKDDVMKKRCGTYRKNFISDRNSFKSYCFSWTYWFIKSENI